MFEPASEQISRTIGQNHSECTAEGSEQRTLRKDYRVCSLNSTESE